MKSSDVQPVLYAAAVSVLANPQLYSAAYAAASPERREKTDRYRFAKDRYLSLGAELLLHFALRNMGINEIPASFDYGTHEKPYLKGSGVYFSISHSEKWAVCAAADCEVGCDVEKIAPIDLKIAKRFFSGAEYEDIAVQPTPEAQNEMFYRYWTLKESFMKATGLGMALPLNAFHIVRGSRISVVQSVDARDYYFTEYTDIPGFKCALCAPQERCAPALQIIDLENLLSDNASK